MPTTKDSFIPGLEINNNTGAITIAYHATPKQEGNRTAGIVLALRASNIHPYVTWIVFEDGSTEHGHYSSSIIDAVQDYQERIERGY